MDDGYSRLILLAGVVLLFLAAGFAIWRFIRSRQENVTEEDIKDMVNEGHEQGVLESSEDDCLSAAVRKAYDLTPAGIIKQLNLLNPIYSRTAAGGHFGREDFPWENVEHMSDLAAYIV